MLIIILLTVNFAFSQNKNISVGIIGGAGHYNYSFWDFPDTIMYYSFPLQKAEHKFVNKTNFETGIGVNYSVNKLNFGLQFLYSAKDYIVDYNFDTNQTINGTVALGIDKSILRFRYIDANITAGYNLLSETSKIKLIPTLLLGIGSLINSETKMIGTDGSIYIDKNATDNIVNHKAEKIVYNGAFAINLQYSINNNVAVFISPYIKRYAIQITKDPMNNCPMVYGANSGIIFSLNKLSNE